MTVLITGGAGFIGSHLAKELDDHGLEYVIMDKEIDSKDLCTPGIFSLHVKLIKPSRVIHLAAQVGRLFGEDDIKHTIDSNALMTTLIANTCAENKIPLTYVSTSEIYGDQGDLTCYEHGAKDLPHNLYGLTKYWGEMSTAMYMGAAKVPFQIIRLSMPYGPGMVPGRGRAAIINMIWQANTGQSIPVHRGSERAWCWVGDTVRGIRMVIESGEQCTSHRDWQYDGRGCYNIGRSDNPISMTEVATIACDLAGVNTDLIDIVDPPGMQTVVKRLSNEKLRILGWTPEVEIEEGMTRVWEEVMHFDVDGVDSRLAASNA